MVQLMPVFFLSRCLRPMPPVHFTSLRTFLFAASSGFLLTKLSQSKQICCQSFASLRFPSVIRLGTPHRAWGTVRYSVLSIISFLPNSRISTPFTTPSFFSRTSIGMPCKVSTPFYIIDKYITLIIDTWNKYLEFHQKIERCYFLDNKTFFI
jgi:hypothetical protein